MEKAKIVAIEELRINSDGPGVCTLVHTYGCSLRCCWCCNPQTLAGNAYKVLTTEDLFEKVYPHNLYYQTTGGGITFSGGEPLLWTEFIAEFSKYCIENHWKLNVETALNVSSKTVIKIAGIVDNFLIDLKTMDSQTHEQYTGCGNEKILMNISLLCGLIDTDKIQINLPLIQGLNDSVENIMEMCAFMKKNNLRRINVIPYRNVGLEMASILGIKQIEFQQNTPENLERVKEMINNNLG